MLSLLLLFPVAALVALVLGAPAKPAAFLAALGNFLVSIAIAVRFVPGVSGFQFEVHTPWVSFDGAGNVFSALPSIFCHLGIDGLSLPLLVATTLITLAAVSLSPRRLPQGTASFYGLLLTLALGLVGVFISVDLFFIFFFATLSMLPLFLLIGGWGGRNRRFASLQAALCVGLGALVLLLALVALVSALPLPARTFDLKSLMGAGAGMLIGPQVGPLLFGLLLAGCGLLIPLVPFHTWFAPAESAAPPPAAMLHGALFKNVGFYLLLRVAWPLFPEVARQGHAWLVGIALAQALGLGLVALAQRELPLLVASWSAMRTGGLFLGLLAWNRQALSGLVLWMAADAVAFALLFGAAGEIVRRTGEARLEYLGGLARRAPWLAGIFGLGALALFGFPGLPNFSGQEEVFLGAWIEHPRAVFWLVGGFFLAAVFLARALAPLYLERPTARLATLPAADLSGPKERRPFYLLAAGLLALGLLAAPVLRDARAAASVFFGGMP